MCLLQKNRSWYASATDHVLVRGGGQLVRCTSTGAVLGHGC